VACTVHTLDMANAALEGWGEQRDHTSPRDRGGSKPEAVAAPEPIELINVHVSARGTRQQVLYVVVRAPDKDFGRTTQAIDVTDGLAWVKGIPWLTPELKATILSRVGDDFYPELRASLARSCPGYRSNTEVKASAGSFQKALLRSLGAVQM
jgi:hypothetical protein